MDPSNLPSELPKYKSNKGLSDIWRCCWIWSFTLILNLEIHPTSLWFNMLIISVEDKMTSPIRQSEHIYVWHAKWVIRSRARGKKAFSVEWSLTKKCLHLVMFSANKNNILTQSLSPFLLHMVFLCLASTFTSKNFNTPLLQILLIWDHILF